MINLPIVIAILMLVGAVILLRRSVREGASEKVIGRLQGDFVAEQPERLRSIQRELLRAGIKLSFTQVLLLFIGWLLLLAVVLLVSGGWLTLMVAIGSVACVRIYIVLRFQRRLRRMIDQLPQVLDHIIRSLKSGRTLGDGLVLAFESAQEPLQSAFLRTGNSIQRGMPLADALNDFARLYDREEFYMLALSISVNQRYGGNAGEVLENLITLIRDRDQAARQLRALTGETRMSALVLGGLPIAMAGYMFISSPELLLGMWEQSAGRMVLLIAFLLQVVGTYLLWRMMRSI